MTKQISNGRSRDGAGPTTQLGGGIRRKGLTKTIGLAAIAALAAMAFLGVASASAGSTSVCKVDESPCASGNRKTHSHSVDPAALLLNDITGYIECIGLFLGDTLAAQSGLGSPLHVTGNLSYSSCEDEAGRACTATELNGPALITGLRVGVEASEITGEAEVLVRCGFFIHCVYNGEGLSGGGEGALLSGGTGFSSTHNAVTNRVSGFLCPETTELDILYAPLSASYISA